MNKLLLSWIKAHEGEVVSSPRKRAKAFEIVDVDEVKERVLILFSRQQISGITPDF